MEVLKSAPFEDNTFDAVVSIGCFHHTGDLKKAIQEACRVLKKDGKIYLMVYNKYSYRQLAQFPVTTIKRFFEERFKPDEADKHSTQKERASFDINQDGEGAPETKFYSSRELKKIMADAGFGDVKTQTENAEDQNLGKITVIKRDSLLKNIARVKGLDIYFSGVKL